MNEPYMLIGLLVVWFVSWIFVCCVMKKIDGLDPEGFVVLILFAIPFAVVIIIDYATEYIKKKRC